MDAEDNKSGDIVMMQSRSRILEEIRVGEKAAVEGKVFSQQEAFERMNKWLVSLERD